MKPEFFMNGKEVFYFAIKNVPNLIKNLIVLSKTKIEKLIILSFIKQISLCSKKLQKI